MLLKQLKMITFDVTNTLLKFKVPPWEAYGTVARKYGFTGKDEDLLLRFIDKYKDMWLKYPNFGKNSNLSWKEWWREIVRYTFKGQVLKSADIELIANHLITEYNSVNQWKCVNGAETLLQFLREKNLIIGIISNFDPRLHEILRNTELDHHFDFVLTSYEVGFCKPDSRIFEQALKQFGNGISPNMCLHIGDDVNKDYEGALAAGWHGLLINDECDEKLKDHTIPSLEHLLPFIQKKVTCGK